MNIRSRQLGDRLLQRMAEKDWGVREMSRKPEVSAQWVSAVTRGLTRPDPARLARFLTTLEIRGAEYRELSRPSSGRWFYLDSEVSSLFLEEPHEIRAYRRVLEGLDGSALDEAHSREFIADLANRLYSSGADHDVDLA